MSFEPGITIFRVNEPVLLENTSSPGFDNFTLYSIQGESIIELADNFIIGKTLEYSYSTEGVRTVRLQGIKSVSGTTFLNQKSVTFSVGYAPTDVLSYTKRSDQSPSYTQNYVLRGISFQVDLVEITTGTLPKTYVWNYGGGQTFSVISGNPQYISFSTTGLKNIGLTVSNIYGTASSNINFISIDTPIIAITASPPFGIVRTGEALTLTAVFVAQNQHSWEDLNYGWSVNGTQFGGRSLSLNYDYGITVGITFSYSSLILTSLSGSTFGQYNVLEVPGIYSIHVSGTTGNDSWSGKYSGISGTEGPVKTLARAAQLAAGYTGLLDVHVKIGAGTYQFTEQSFYLTGGDSGIGRTITYTPLNGNKVIISGGYTVSPALFTQVTAGNIAIYNRLKTSAQGNVYGADLSPLGISFGLTLPLEWNGRAVQNKYLPSVPDLFFNEIKMTVARWPNKPGYTSETNRSFDYNSSAIIESVVESGSASDKPPRGTTSGIFKYPLSDVSVINRWNVTGPSSYDGIWIHGFWKWDWSDEVFKVKSINKVTREIEVHSENGVYALGKNNPCASPGNPFAYANPTNRRWFAFNLLEELDSPGEYYLDRSGQKLYFWPPSSIGSTSDIVLSSIRTAGDNSWVPGTVRYNDTAMQSQTNINTNAVNASLFKFYKLKNVIIDSLEFQHMSGSGIEMILCENVTIKNCIIQSPRKNGIMIVGGKDNTVDNCEINYPGTIGVILSGGNRRTLVPANNILKNSKIIGCGTNTCNYARAVLLTGVGNIVRKNIIANSGSKAMHIHGNDHIVEYNNFTNLILEQDDTGGIYIANNISDRNTIIRYNFFNGVNTKLPGGPAYDGKLTAGGCPTPPTKIQLASAIYIDEYNCGVNIQSNVFYNCGSTLSDGGGAIFITHGLDHVIDNNIIIDSRVGVGQWYSKKSDWNTNSKGFKSGPDNIDVGSLQQIINIDDEPWYEEGAPESTSGPSILFPGRNYTPYSFFASGYGVEGTYRSTKGLLNKVNITDETWTAQYPQLAGYGGMVLYDANNYLLSFNPLYQMTNYVSDNAFINVTNNTLMIRSDSESTFTVGNYYNYNNYDIFVDKNNLNFKLTPEGLAQIKQSVPNFEDIPFEEIPVL
jgi:hypothetical protein